jgi:uncharacterized protein involved in outer membrane biogenesis
MRSFRWLFISGGIVVVLLVLAIAIGAAWLNTFIHSDSFRHEVETRAGDTLGGPVKIDAIDLDVFGRISLRGVSTQVDSSRVNGQGTLVAKVESVKCSYSLLALLSGRVTLTALTLEKPEIVLTRQPPATISPAVHPDVNAGQTPQPAKTAPLKTVLDGADIIDGSLSIRNADGATLTVLQGIDVGADTSGYFDGKDVTGSLKIASLSFSPNLQLTGFSTPWTYGPRDGSLSAKPFEAFAFGGRLAGDFSLDETGPSVLDVNGKALDVGQISRAAHPSSGTRLSGSLDLQSKWRGIESGQINGEGDFQLTNGKLEGVRLLQELAGILRVNELNAPILRKVQSHFQVANGQTRFTGLQLDANVFQMTGDGVIGADGGLDANLVLILTRDSMGRIPREVLNFFVQQQDGSGSVGFHLGGTIDHPQTDLATRILLNGAGMKNVISKALNKFFH